MNFSFALIIFTSIALITCLFMVTYFVVIKKEHKLMGLSLGLVFLAIALRISKSVFYYVFSDISTIGVSLGFLGFACIGPLLLFYFKYSDNRNYKLNFKDTIHFVFAVAGIVVISSLDSYAGEFYIAAKYQLGAYLAFIGYRYIYVGEAYNLSQWHTTLFYAIVVLLGVLIFQYFVGNIESYTIGTAMTSLILYVLFFIALKSPTATKKISAADLPKALISKIKNAIEADKIYTQPAITLAQFSEAIETPAYLVSRATKIIYNKSFPEVINCFRIKDITQMLSEPNHCNDKIEDLAYDVGFNTSSAFYNAFKKETSMTPRAYQKLQQTNIL